MRSALGPVDEQARVSRSGSQTRARSESVMVRLTPAEKATYSEFAAKLGRSVPDLMRLAVEAALLQEGT